MKKVFIVEDDENIRELVCYALESGGYKAEGFPDAKAFYARLDEEMPNLVLLDIMLEGEDGYRILKTIRGQQRTHELPVILLTAKTEEMDKVRGLDMGADDYVTKPFSVLELLSRVKAVLRRAPQPDSGKVLRFKNLVLDPKRREVYLDDEEISLTYKEFEMLRLFLENEEMVLSRNKLMNDVWGTDYLGESRTVDVHVRTLRQKLGDMAKHLQTVRNVGYKWGE